MNQPTPTLTTSAVHLKMALCAFRNASNREERIAIAGQHKPYMLEDDVVKMREAFVAHHG